MEDDGAQIVPVETGDRVPGVDAKRLVGGIYRDLSCQRNRLHLRRDLLRVTREEARA